MHMSFLMTKMSFFTTNHTLDNESFVILLAARWKDHFITWGMEPINQVIWVLLKIGGVFWDINVYSSNNAHDYCSLWKWYAFSLPPIVWVIYGDFNMI